MMKYFGLLFFFFFSGAYSQSFVDNQERYPIFPECGNVAFEQEENCFNQTLKLKIREEFKLPEVVAESGYRGEVVVLFEVTDDGGFETLYVDAMYKELEEEVLRVFDSLPQVKPATYDNRPIDMQFRMPIRIPLEDLAWVTPDMEEESLDAEPLRLEEQEK